MSKKQNVQFSINKPKIVGAWALFKSELLNSNNGSWSYKHNCTSIHIYECASASVLMWIW